MDEPVTETKYFIGIKFQNSDKSYYFSTVFPDLKKGDLVVVDTPSGYEMATVSTSLMDQANYHGELELKPILRKPTKEDLEDYEFGLAQNPKALAIADREAKRLNLPMNFLQAAYNLDGSRITITYTSTEYRVDFRELLKVLAPLLHARIDFRQLNPRERARQIGGIGICGLPLCCSTFLTWSQTIGIALAKNQMLTLNIPKLSGLCGKLMCCLAYEDETYTIEKKDFPSMGTVVHLDEGDYHVDSFNIVSRTVRLANATRDDYKTYPLEDVKAMMNGTYKKPVDVTPKENEFASFNIPGLTDASYPGLHPDKNDKGNYQSAARPQGKGRDNNRNGNNNRSNQRHGQPNNRNGQQNQNRQGQQNQQNSRQNRPQNGQRNNQSQGRNQNQGNRQNNGNRPNNNRPNNGNHNQNQGQQNQQRPHQNRPNQAQGQNQNQRRPQNRNQQQRPPRPQNGNKPAQNPAPKPKDDTSK